MNPILELYLDKEQGTDPELLEARQRMPEPGSEQRIISLLQSLENAVMRRASFAVDKLRFDIRTRRGHSAWLPLLGVAGAEGREDLFMIQEVELHMHHYGATITCSNSVFKTDYDAVFDNVRCYLETSLAGEQQSPFKWRTPSSWWQHFKKDCFPAWLLKRFPIKEQEHEVSVATLYPFLKTQLPIRLQGERVLVLVNGSPIGAFMSDTEALTPLQWRERAHEMLKSDRFKAGTT